KSRQQVFQAHLHQRKPSSRNPVGSRCLIHIYVLAGNPPTHANQTYYIHSLPPSDRRSNGANEQGNSLRFALSTLLSRTNWVKIITEIQAALIYCTDLTTQK